MGFPSRAIVAAALAMPAACGLVSGLDSLEVQGDASSADSSLDAVKPDASVNLLCDASVCGSLGVPTGWTPVAYHQGAGCPNGYASQKYVAQPTAACGCSCLVVSPPSCVIGNVPTFYGNTCNSPGLAIPANNGNCTNLGNSATLQPNFEATPVGPSGGACVPIPTSDASATNVEACVPSCGDAICQGAAPEGFQACLLAEGSKTCPQGTPFTLTTQIGTSATASCPSCTCSVTGTCSNPKIEFFSDLACFLPVATLAADGTCQATGANSKSVQSAKYMAQANGACSVNDAGAGSATLNGVHTICCKP